ncbi:MAG: bifunctional 2-polyprenyl-6-hydroxyphenol methylase/3-demethylubiquinol 3-O-methyltransferase UbiG [Pseudomonadota bacterium]
MAGTMASGATNGPTGASASADPAELAKFEAMAAEWWDPDGKFRPLHMMQPCRLGYAVAQIAAAHGRDPREKQPFKGLKLLDIGCGGGLLCEPMVRLGAEVTGVDPAARNIPVARLHAEQSGLEIDYRVASAEDLLAEGLTFDVVLNMEVVEHVPDPRAYIAACAGLLAPGGVMVASTISRSLKALALAKIGAEYVLRWLPVGTHDWRKFIMPEELTEMLTSAGLSPLDASGFVFNPVAWEWRLSETDLSVNYAVAAKKPDA